MSLPRLIKAAGHRAAFKVVGEAAVEPAIVAEASVLAAFDEAIAGGAKPRRGSA